MSNNKNKPGYKKTPVGWIPEEWECVSSGEVYEIQLGKMLSGAAHLGKHPQPYLANFNVRWGSFDLSRVQKMDFSEAERIKFELRNGDLLVCEGGEPGRAAIWDERIKPCYYQKALHRLRAKDHRIQSAFMQAFLQRVAGSPILENLTSQTSIAHLTREKLQALPVPLPSPSEQKKIAEILSTWDEVISETRRLLDAKKRRKKALMQQLLTGKKRLPGVRDKWRNLRLQDVCTIEKGEQRNRSILKDSGTYPVINGGQTPSGFTDVWNTEAHTITISEGGNSCGFVQLQDKRFWCGGHCYALANIKCHRLFLFQMLKHHELHIMLLRVGSGLPNIQKKDLAMLRLLIPEPLPEQRAIAEVLSTADSEIALLESKLAALVKQKKGLMQKLLTGEVRVRV